jgi:hypothetical protein
MLDEVSRRYETFLTGMVKIKPSSEKDVEVNLKRATYLTSVKRREKLAL